MKTMRQLPVQLLNSIALCFHTSNTQVASLFQSNRPLHIAALVITWETAYTCQIASLDQNRAFITTIQPPQNLTTQSSQVLLSWRKITQYRDSFRVCAVRFSGDGFIWIAVFAIMLRTVSLSTLWHVTLNKVLDLSDHCKNSFTL